MSEQITEMGPIDYLLIEWPGEQPQGDAAPLLIDLVDRGLIRILDLTRLRTDADGDLAILQAVDVEAIKGLEELLGASSGLLDDDDVHEAGNALEPGTAAALIVFENSWAAPFATAVRRSGGQLVANGRIPVQSVLEALESAEAR